MHNPGPFIVYSLLGAEDCLAVQALPPPPDTITFYLVAGV